MWKLTGAIQSTEAALERLRPFLVPHDRIIGAVGARVARPDSVDWALGCTYQGYVNCCTGHGFEKLAWGTAKAQGHEGERGDELGIYALRANDYVASNPDYPMRDDGAQPATIAHGILDVGILPRGLGPTSPGDRLSLTQIEQATAFRLPQMAHINLGGDALVETILDALAAGRIPAFTMPVPPPYNVLRPGDVYDGPTSGPLHCQAFDAYRRGKTGIELGVAGSWGPNWADGGRAWLAAGFVGRAVTEVYIADSVPPIRRPS